MLVEAETSDEVSEDAAEEIAAVDPILQEEEVSEDSSVMPDDADIAEVVVDAELEEVIVEESLEDPVAETDESTPETPVEVDEQAEVVEEAVARDEAAMVDSDWFVVHCYSGYENKVRHNLEQRIETMGMKDKIFDVVVPTEEEIEVKDGKRRTVERRVFPGYILVQMILDEDSWYVVRNTPGVTGFVGMGNEPTPLRPEEVVKIVKRMEAEAPRIKLAYSIGQKVRITDGPFNDFIGTVADIDMERAIVRVMVSFFGRETPVELDFLQVDKA
jgi:transcriptional antiterminator NusG